MQQKIKSFIVDPDILDKIFIAFENKSPFNLKKSIKNIMNEYSINDVKEFYVYLSLELNVAYSNAKQSNYIYHNKKYFKIAIIKLRMKDRNNNSGKSKGWRIIALVDDENNIFYLLDLYSHSQGKDNLSYNEEKKIRLLCDEYAENVTIGGKNE